MELQRGTKKTLLRRESSQIEFKKNFNSNSLCEYGKILSSMANNKGGYIVFGITENRPHEICGMSSDQFVKIDPSRISNLFDEHFSPRLRWDQHTELRNRVKIGLMHVEQSVTKPVICVKSGNRGEYKPGEIYYRYPGKTTLIKPSELQTIIEERIESINLKWRNLLGNIAKTTPTKTALLNTESGKLIGDKNIIVIDKNLLSEMRFIKEGDFKQENGKPVYKIVGEIKEIGGATFIEKEKKVPHLIHKTDIIDSFLNENCDHPIVYLKQFPYESTIYLPIWYFIKKSELSIAEVENKWSELDDVNNFVRKRLVNRLKNEDFEKLKVGRIAELEGDIFIKDLTEYDNKYKECKDKNWNKVKSDLALERSFLFELINNNCSKYFDNNLIKKKYRLIFEAISHLQMDKIQTQKEELIRIIKQMREIKMSSPYLSNFRKSICYVDCMLHRNDVC